MAKASKAVVSWSAEQLLGLLRAKHEKDVFVTECKTGPSWATARPTASRLDAWALKRSWTPVETIGYEIKVDRRDFQADKKWGEYLRYCHKFFFVSPAGLVQPAEIPAGVGLLWTAGEHRLVTKVPAARREPEAAAAAELMVYVLMSRVRVVADMWEANGVHPVDMPRGAARAEQIRRWVAQAEEHGRLAEFVGGHVRRRVEEAAERLK